MTLTDYARAVHALNVEHGFYDPEPSNDMLVAAIHSEISEAFVEWQCNRPQLYHTCTVDGDTCITDRCAHYVPDEHDCALHAAKPEGISTELIDVALRLLDYAAYRGARVNETDVPLNCTLPELVCILHRKTCKLTRIGTPVGEITQTVSTMIGMIRHYVETNSNSFADLLSEKCSFNKTRPHRHGGKRI